MAHIPSRWRALSAVPVLFACAVCPAVAQDPEFRVAERYDREALGQLRELGVAFEEDPSGTPVAAFVGVLAPEGCRLFRRVPTVREPIVQRVVRFIEPSMSGLRAMVENVVARPTTGPG